MDKSKEYQDREELLLDVGRKLLVSQGFMGLQMESIATQTSLSRATVYKHFRSKEELATKIAFDSSQLRYASLEKALSFSGTTRERMLALLIAEEQFASQHSDRYPSELIVRVSGVFAKSRPDIQSTSSEMDLRIRALFGSLIEQAVRQGDLPTDCNSDDLLGGIMALCIGVQVWNLLGITRFATNRFVLSPTFIQRMLDGFQWRPLADQWSYDECTQRILQFLKN